MRFLFRTFLFEKYANKISFVFKILEKIIKVPKQKEVDEKQKYYSTVNA